jgi:two-component system response regulator NreC
MPEYPTRNTAITILIADDHAVVRCGLRMLVNAQADMQVIGEASNGRDAVQLAAVLSPAVILMDISLPELSGIAATEQIVRNDPGAKVIALSMYEDQAYVRSFFSAGGRGYVPKRAADTHLLDAIRAVQRGRVFLDPDLSGGMVSTMLCDSRSSRKSAKPVLSKREHDVLVLLAQGYTNNDIAVRMNVSVKTIDTYRARLSTKLGLRSRPEIVRYALEMGLLTPEKTRC